MGSSKQILTLASHFLLSNIIILFFYIVFITDGTSSKLGKRRKADDDDDDVHRNNDESCSKSRQESADSRGGKSSQKKKKRNKSSNISLGLQLNKANTKIEALEKLIDELKEEGEALEKQIDELKEDAETQLEKYTRLLDKYRSASDACSVVEGQRDEAENLLQTSGRIVPRKVNLEIASAVRYTMKAHIFSDMKFATTQDYASRALLTGLLLTPMLRLKQERGFKKAEFLVTYQKTAKDAITQKRHHCHTRLSNAIMSKFSAL